MTIVRGRWFPALVIIPGMPKPWRRCYVLAADDGLHVFRQRGEQADWHSGIDWTATVLPTTQREVQRGVSVHTDDGLVVVTLGSGCSCGSMGNWRGPSWAREELARP